MAELAVRSAKLRVVRVGSGKGADSSLSTRAGRTLKATALASIRR